MFWQERWKRWYVSVICVAFVLRGVINLFVHQSRLSLTHMLFVYNVLAKMRTDSKGTG